LGYVLTDWIHMLKLHKLILLVLFAAFLPSSIFAQSRIPKESDNWLQTTGIISNGDSDGVLVAFFEVEDTLTSSLYIAVRDPGCDAVWPDQGAAGTTDFYLIGGPGTLSSSDSRQINYSGDRSLARTGTELDTILDADNTAPFNNQWVYFNAVQPYQGEHIGNKYYFKVVAEPDVNVEKNAFQLDISSSGSGAPTGLTGVRSFAYMWSLALDNAARTWEIFPFVPEGATGSIEFRNWDFDSGETMRAYDISGTDRGAVTSSGQGSTWPTSQAMTPFTIGTQTGGTWKLEITETATPAYINTAEVWFTNSVTSEVYRAYSSSYVPSAAHHIRMTAEDGLAGAGVETERVVLQVVNSSGNPEHYSRSIYLTADGSALITAASSALTGLPSDSVLVETDNEGIAWIDVEDAAAEVIRIDAVTDGSIGSSLLPGTNDPVFINFHAPGLGALDHIKIVRSPEGSEVTTAAIVTNQTLTLYAAGYDSGGRFRSLVNAVWGSTGTLDPVSQTGTSISFSQSTEGSGTITADDQQGHTDSTGTITVTGGQVDMEVRNNIINPRLGESVEVVVALSTSQRITAKVYDLAGDPVKTLTDQNYSAGNQTISWNGRSKGNRAVVPGVYFIVVNAGSSRQAFKVLVVK
jgi:hypothetical protein